MVCALLASMAVAADAGAAEPFDAHGSVEQVYATGLTPGASVTLYDGQSQEVETRTANDLGGTLFRNVTPGDGYRVAADGTTSEPLQVLTSASEPPNTDFYGQSIPESGYGYLTTRDGTKLAIYVHPPQDVTHVLPGAQLPPLPAGPTPTLIEYSGYGYADPAGPQSGISIIANLMGFTVVDVNMRGTGCSGGAFDFFEPLQKLDGYDVVEAVAHQPWVLNNEVGMMGISYGGISQLFTAATQPPDLAAISPLSVIDATQTTLYPGGILNTGFAVEWAKERVHDAEAAADGHGQAWAYKRIQEGDQTCADNQALHPEAADLIKKIDENDHYVPEVADPLAPVTFVDQIEVPTFMACQWTDEQTGGHCPTLAEHMTGTDRKWFTFTNGTHVDSLDPVTFNRWYDFLQLYVAKRPPILASAAIQAAAPLIYEEAMGIQGVTLPPDPIQLQPTYDGALAAFEELKPVTVLFDNGAGGHSPGQPYPGFEASFDQFPVPGNRGKVLVPVAGRWPERRAAGRTRRRRLHLGRPRAAPHRLHRRHRRGRRRPLDRDSRVRMGTEPAGQRRLLSQRSARRRHDGDRRGRRQRLGPLLGARASTCRRRSARSGPTARRPSCRTAGYEAWRASSTRRRAPRSSRCRAFWNPTSRRSRQTTSPRSPSRSTTRAMSTAPAPASG